MRIMTRYLTFAALIAGALALSQINAAPQAAGGGQWVELSFRLPAIGNVDQVKQWEFGRIANMSRRGQEDVLLEIRDKAGATRQVVCPAGPFTDLARVSNWMTDTKDAPTARDYIERMVAFAADENGRVIGLVSLEPLPRNARKIAEAYGRR